MRGHIAKKGNRYYAVIYEGVDPATGKDKRRWHPAGDNRKDAERVLADLIKRVHDGDYRSPDKITLGDYMLKRWLPAKRARLKPSTAESYERIIRLHINPNIGHIPVQKLRPEDLDTLYARLLTEGKRNGSGGGLSAQTVRNVHITIQGALSDAERKGTVVRNVADLADAPTTSRNSRTMSVWTSDELRAFLDAISDHYLYALYLLAATTGMRRAEIAGLVWRNVDLDTARLTVSQQLLSVEYKLIESDLKTPTSRRTIDLDPHTVAQAAAAPAPPARRSHGHRSSPQRRLRLRQTRRIAHPPRPHQPDLRTPPRQDRPAPHPPTRPAPHPRHDPAATRRQPQSRQRTPRPRQRLIHHGRLPTRPTRHASPSRRHLRNRHLRRQLRDRGLLGTVAFGER